MSNPQPIRLSYVGTPAIHVNQTIQRNVYLIVITNSTKNKYYTLSYIFTATGMLFNCPLYTQLTPPFPINTLKLPVNVASSRALYSQRLTAAIDKTQEHECHCGTHGLSNPLCEDGPELGCGCTDDLVLHITVGPMHKRRN